MCGEGDILRPDIRAGVASALQVAAPQPLLGCAMSCAVCQRKMKPGAMRGLASTTPDSSGCLW
jgi:hypothetical protein